MSEKFEPFWVVRLGSDYIFRRVNLSLDDARLEAEELLNLPDNKGRKAYILTCHSVGQIQEAVVWRY